MIIRKLYIKNLDPLRNQCIKLIPKEPFEKEGKIGWANVLIGQNGTGKSRVIACISHLFGDQSNIESRGIKHIAQYLAVCKLDDQWMLVQGTPNTNQATEIARTKDANLITEYESQYLHSVVFKPKNDLSWSSLDNTNKFARTFLVSCFSGVAKINSVKLEFMKALDQKSTDKLDFRKNHSDDLSQSLANLLMTASLENIRNSTDQGTRATKVLQKLEAALSKIVGQSVYFGLDYRPKNAVHLVFNDTKIGFSHLPDGLRSILGWLVVCIGRIVEQFPDEPNPLEIPQLILLDEPETHLHPGWQRQIIPATQELIPNSQIIVATHSPFVLSSVNSGMQHLFTREKSTVEVKSKLCSAGDSYIEAAESLGAVEWYDPETENMLKEFRLLKEQFFQDNTQLTNLERMAAEIGSRSSSLSDLMQREVNQLLRLAKGGKENA